MANSRTLAILSNVAKGIAIALSDGRITLRNCWWSVYNRATICLTSWRGRRAAMAERTYEALKETVLRLRREGKIAMGLTPEERADWAYGTTVIENSAITREMADTAVAEKGSPSA